MIMIFEEFENEIEIAVGQIPKQFRRIFELEAIQIIPREKAPPKVNELFPNQIVFGLFVGQPRNKVNTFSFQLEPTRIELYQESFEKVYGPALNSKIKEQIIRTVIHEIAHYMGFDEAQVRALGY